MHSALPGLPTIPQSSRLDRPLVPPRERPIAPTQPTNILDMTRIRSRTPGRRERIEAIEDRLDLFPGVIRDLPDRRQRTSNNDNTLDNAVHLRALRVDVARVSCWCYP